MERQVACLIEACKQLGMRYECIDNEQNLVRVYFNHGAEYFELNKTPFNSESIYGICRDKMHSYQAFNQVVAMPETLSFLDPNVPDEYKHYLQYQTMDEIVVAVERQFGYPVVVKSNSGALGVNVHLCRDQASLIAAFTEIFNGQSKHYDYLALAQAYVENKAEYRLVCGFGEPLLAYKRGMAQTFNVRYWEKNEVATLEQDEALITALFEFVKPVFELANIGFVGFDIILGQDDQFYLIELNSSPKFNHLIIDNPELGPSAVASMYKNMLLKLNNRVT
ncbi:ATP-grasp domain-containing protein [Pseudoalteromonas rubra]|nr:ATP-grasp domain-containing protein [Pseudoalteromonas rubra]